MLLFFSVNKNKGLVIQNSTPKTMAKISDSKKRQDRRQAKQRPTIADSNAQITKLMWQHIYKF